MNDGLKLGWPEDGSRTGVVDFCSTLAEMIGEATYLYFIPYPRVYEAMRYKLNEQFGPARNVYGKYYVLAAWTIASDQLEKACYTFFTARFPELIIISSITQLDEQAISEFLVHQSNSPDCKIFYFTDNEWIPL